MKERGILFKDFLVRKILAGEKTQTRRLLKSTGTAAPVEEPWISDQGVFFSCATDGTSAIVKCPYGTPGDRLWVRETWLQWACPQHDEGQPPGTRCDCDDPKSLRYRADGEIPAVRWKPSIFMPRWASRITLELTEVRVQRVQDITRADAIAEGMDSRSFKQGYCPRAEFCEAWDRISADRGGSWAANPWVWALTFRRVEAKERAG